MAAVTIYEHANFQGRSQVLTKGQYDNALGQISIGNDSLSSIQVSQGLVARLYEHFLFRGAFIDIRTDTPAINLPWNDRASSIVVYDEGQQPSIKPYGPVVGINSLNATSGGRAGVYGESQAGTGVIGQSNDGIGVFGESKNSEGVRGVSHNAHGGVVGINDWSPSAPPGAGGNGGWFESTQGEGVRGWSKTPHHGGVVGVNTAGGVGVYGEGRVAGFFQGDVEVTGDIRLTNADCAEDFNVSEEALVEPGTVMVLGEEEILLPSHQAYDKRVAGVISGAGNYKPGIVLDKQESQQRRLPVALLGKVFCKVDAQYSAIEVGDLLTTSSTPGHAMKADDPLKAFGTVIGKALRPLKEGQGLIPILIALQ
jgi:hypothetical protein